jgi:hypothetical protein
MLMDNKTAYTKNIEIHNADKKQFLASMPNMASVWAQICSENFVK